MAIAQYRALRTLLFLLTAGACHGQTFTVSANPSSLVLYPGQQSIPVPVMVQAASYAGPVTVTMMGLPSGVTVTPLTLTSSGAGTLFLSASPAAGQEGFSPIYIATNTTWTAPVTLIAAAGSSKATSQFFLTISISNPSFAPGPSAINLPVATINTNGAPIVSKTVDVPGTITITSADGQTSWLPNSSDTDNTATFHVHGNSTALMPKLPYHVKLNTSLDLLNTMGLQCPYIAKGLPACDKSKSFILLANYDDKTFLRDWAASALANAIPIGNGYLNSPANSPTPSGTGVLMPWAPHSLFVELYVNGVYEGNYQLIEEIKVDSHRVNITELAETDTSSSKVTGGYLMEIDAHQDEAFTFVTPQNVDIGLIDPDFSPDPEVPEQTTYISNYVDSAENALFSGAFTDPAQGWRAWFDEAAAVNFYIVNDLMGNVDGGIFLSSDYLYKDRNNPLLYMGPIWDFDISSGNTNYTALVNPLTPWMQVYAPWYIRWFQDQGFRSDVAKQWNLLKSNGVLSSWIASIQTQSVALAQSQTNNFGRWPMQGIEVWPNPEAAGSYAGEVQYLANWLNLRLGYLDSLFNSKAATTTTLSIASGQLLTGSPVTLTAKIAGAGNPAGTVSFLVNGIVLAAGPLNASGSAVVTLAGIPQGIDTLQAVYNGDNSNALSVSSAQPVTVSSALAATVTSLAGPFAGPNGTQMFTASVLSNSSPAVSSGTVAFTLDSSQIATVSLDANGQATWNAGVLAAGSHTVGAQYSGNSTYLSSAGSPINFLAGTVTTAPAAGANAPTINGVVNAAGGSQFSPQVVAPGSYIAIYGTGLAGNGAPAASSLPLPTTLNGAQVSLGGVAMPLLYAGSGQINALVPQGLAPYAAYPLVVTQGGIQSAPINLNLIELQPGIYTLDASGSGAGVVTNALTGAVIGNGNPAQTAEYLTVYCTGLGPVAGPNGQAGPQDGVAAPLSPIFQTVSTFTATIGGINAVVTFAGLTPTLAGLYQVNLQVPAGVVPGDNVPLVLNAPDPATGAFLQSNIVSIAVR